MKHKKPDKEVVEAVEHIVAQTDSDVFPDVFAFATKSPAYELIKQKLTQTLLLSERNTSFFMIIERIARSFVVLDFMDSSVSIYKEDYYFKQQSELRKLVELFFTLKSGGKNRKTVFEELKRTVHM